MVSSTNCAFTEALHQDKYIDSDLALMADFYLSNIQLHELTTKHLCEKIRINQLHLFTFMVLVREPGINRT